MPLLRRLTKDEQDAFIHKIRNQNTKSADLNNDIIITEMVNKTWEEKLAKISEEENFNAKNRYRLNKKLLSFADKKRMPIDESKVKDVLMNRTVTRLRME